MTTSDQHLSRKLGLIGLSATGICSMLGASIYIVPFMIHRNVPGIGPYVLPAFMLAAIPAILAAIAYAILGSAMPRAGGSYIYASRGLHPYLGFIASFAQWFGLSVAIGVIAYVIIPFIRDIFVALEMETISHWLETGWVRVTLALFLLWFFILVNLRGLKFYQNILIPMMIVMFGLGILVILIGFNHNHQIFFEQLGVNESTIIAQQTTSFNLTTFLSASAILISSFIGFDSIAQAGGEVKNPTKLIPKALLITLLAVGSFYFLFTAAVYHTVPWQYVAQESIHKDLTAPGLLNGIVSPMWIILIITGAAIALINDLPAMLLSVSRLIFAWAKDGIFPKTFNRIHPQTHIPQHALIASGGMASLGILGSHFAGDFFLGVDIMVTSMLVNFILMCTTVLYLPKRNQHIAQQVRVFRNRSVQVILCSLGVILLSIYLIIHIRKDLVATLSEWYFHSTPIWVIVMCIGSAIYFWNIRKLNNSNIDVITLFSSLPSD